MNKFIIAFSWASMVCMAAATILEADPIRAISFGIIHLGLVGIMLTLMVKINE